MIVFVKKSFSLAGLWMLAPLSAASAQSPAVPSMSQSLPPITLGQVMLNAGATFAGSNEPIRSGLVWRIYEDRGDASQPTIVARSTGPTPSFTLSPGNYIIHVAYGFASASKRISVQRGNLNERLAINAGALQLKGAVGGSPIPANRLTFSVYVPEAQNSEGRLVIADAKANDMIRLPEGTYHVVSTYGDANAIMRSDLKVESGRVTEATLNHRAATVILKLVASAGGEAFAGTPSACSPPAAT